MTPQDMVKFNRPQPQVRRSRTCTTHPESNRRSRLLKVLERNTAERNAQRAAHETSPYNGPLREDDYGTTVSVPHVEQVEQQFHHGQTKLVEYPIVVTGTVVRFSRTMRDMFPDCVGLRLRNGQVRPMPAANVAKVLAGTA